MLAYLEFLAKYMIELKRLNGESFMLNPFMIEQVQSLPDTTITLMTGKKIVVQTKQEEVLMKIMDVFKQIGLAGIQVKQVDKDE